MTTGTELSPLRIVLATGTMRVGGTEQQVARLAVELADRGHDVTLVLLNATGPNLSVVADTPVRVIDLGLPPDSQRGISTKLHAVVLYLIGIVRLSLILRRLRPDVVHAFLLVAYAVAIPAAFLAGVPVRVVGHRNIGGELSSRPRRMVMRLCLLISTHATGNAEAVARAFPSVAFPQRETQVLRNGVDLPVRVGCPEIQPPRLVQIANFHRVKNHAMLLQALARLPHCPETVLFGDGEERERLEQLVGDLGLTARVRFAGAVPNAKTQLGDFQLLTLTSWNEGLPNAILEAMAAGLPVVTTDAGGASELVLDGKTGFVIAPGDVAALTDRLRHLIDDPDARQRMGQAGRELILDTHSWSRLVQAYETLYRRGALD